VYSINIFILNDYIFYTIEIITLGAIIFASKKEILDVTAKILGITAGSTIVYNNWIKGSNASGSNNDIVNNKTKNNENKNNSNDK
jgi:hypothetical protein